MTTILLHGFWGQPKDWNAVLERLPLGAQVLIPDLYEAGPMDPSVSLKEWTTRFWRWVDTQVGSEKVNLVGYSMGARLAVNAAVQLPERISRALFVSGNPLLPQEYWSERELWENDFRSAFLNKDWDELERTWQEQPVFQASPAVVRRKTPELREMLGLSLTNWSPRSHPFGAAELKRLPATMEWAFGALDQNYLSVAKTLQELPVKGQISLIPQVGHRVITEAPGFICDWLSR